MLYARPIAMLGKRSQIKNEIIETLLRTNHRLKIPMLITNNTYEKEDRFLFMNDKDIFAMQNTESILYSYKNNNHWYALSRYEVVDIAFCGFHCMLDVESEDELSKLYMKYIKVNIPDDDQPKCLESVKWNLKSSIH